MPRKDIVNILAHETAPWPIRQDDPVPSDHDSKVHGQDITVSSTWIFSVNSLQICHVRCIQTCAVDRVYCAQSKQPRITSKLQDRKRAYLIDRINRPGVEIAPGTEVADDLVRLEGLQSRFKGCHCQRPGPAHSLSFTYLQCIASNREASAIQDDGSTVVAVG